MERIPLSNQSFEGDNNAYLLSAGRETALVDTGTRRGTTPQQLRDGLAAHDVSFSDVDRIFLTHWHADHAGMAGEIQAEGGAEVYAHRRDAPLIEGDRATWERMYARQEERFVEWGVPEPKRTVLVERRPDLAEKEPFPVVTRFDDGETLEAPGLDLTAVHSPGHTDGLCLFEFVADGDREAFSGDVLLPVYTPNVGGADVRVERPLAKYLRSLTRIVEREYARSWPGHREPIADSTGRARHIVDHHRERAYRVLDVLGRHGPADAWTVSAKLFGELDGVHILHGPGEAYAHLEHLERSGEVEREGREYSLADGVAGALERVEDGAWPLEF